MGWEQKRWAGTLAAAIVVAIGIICLVNGARRIGRPFPGFLLAHNGIVVSIGRPDWSGPLDARIPFSQVITVIGTSISSAADIQSHCDALSPGEPVAYRFRKGAEVFDAVVPVRLFSIGDFLALYLNYFLVGIAFASAGLWVLWRLGATQPAAVPFFILCQTCALVLLAAGDVYGPYWFTAAYFTAHCVAPAAVLHFASAFPERLGGRASRAIALTALYGASLALALGLNLVAGTASLFLPLIYTVNLLLANSILLYLGRLVISRSGGSDAGRRRALDFAIAAIFLAASLPAAIFVVYPAVEGLISPLIVVAPFVFFPLLTAVALRRAGAPPARVGVSVRLRLSFLFLAAVETGFLAAIAYFWLSNSWQQLVADLSLYEQQRVRVERLQLDSPSAREDLAEIENRLQTSDSRAAAERARAALEQGDAPAAEEAVRTLADHYRALGEGLENRRLQLGWMDAALVIGLVLVGVLQAVVFMIAVRRWLIQPIDELSRATAVIATGDLSYRSRLDSSAEFASLAESINAMAASLSAIQARVDAERSAREQAAAVARDGERRRLARELHDSVLQDLSAVKLAVESEVRRPAPQRLPGIVDGLIQVIVSLRRVVEDLRPTDLSQVSLGAAIENHARTLAHRHLVRVEVDCTAAAEVAEWAARDVYRVAQEAVSNALRHGGPSRIAIRFFRRGDDIVLEVVDDGAGFDPATVARGGGLAGMTERAAALGARFEIRSKPGAGTTLALSIPPTRTGQLLADPNHSQPG